MLVVPLIQGIQRLKSDQTGDSDQELKEGPKLAPVIGKHNLNNFNSNNNKIIK